ncbi:MAG: hypothetical protein AAF611_15255 [Bacteroidota bacterium]
MNDLFYSTSLDISNTTIKIHPAIDEILTQTAQLAKELGIYESTLYEGHHTMSPYLFTSASPSRVVDATLWFGTLYYLDDFFGEDIQQEISPDFDVLLTCWMDGCYKGTETHSGLRNLYTSLAYCSRQLQKNSPGAFFETYTEGLLAHLKHSINPTEYQSVEEYITSRIHFGGMYPTMGMIEYTENVYLTDAIYTAIPKLKDIQKDCALIGVLSNDIISYHKEKHSQFNLLNAYISINVVAHLEEAIRLAIAVVNTVYHSFETHLKSIRMQIEQFDTTTKQTVLTYLNGLSNIVSASYHWQISTNRYRSEENIFTDLRKPIDEKTTILV